MILGVGGAVRVGGLMEGLGQVVEGDVSLQSLYTADRMGVEMSPLHIQCQHPT